VDSTNLCGKSKTAKCGSDLQNTGAFGVSPTASWNGDYMGAPSTGRPTAWKKPSAKLCAALCRRSVATTVVAPGQSPGLHAL